MYDTVRDLIDSADLVLAGYESDQVETFLERPGPAVADALDDIVAGTDSEYWPALDRDRTQFWFGTKDTYNPADRFHVSIPAEDGDATYHVYGDFNFADMNYKEELNDLQPDYTQASALAQD